MCRIRISLWNSWEKVILHMLKISTKFGVAPQSFCENQSSVENQDQDQDHDITLDFNTRLTFHTWKTPTKFCLDPLTPSKVIVSTWKVHVRTYIQTNRQTEIFFGFFCLLRHKNHEHLSKGENFFFLNHAIKILSLFTYSVCDEKVKMTLGQVVTNFRGQVVASCVCVSVFLEGGNAVTHSVSDS